MFLHHHLGAANKVAGFFFLSGFSSHTAKLIWLEFRLGPVNLAIEGYFRKLTEGPAGPAGPGLPGSPRAPAGPSPPRAP